MFTNKIYNYNTHTIKISPALPSIKTTHKLDKKKGLQEEFRSDRNETQGYREVNSWVLFPKEVCKRQKVHDSPFIMTFKDFFLILLRNKSQTIQIICSAENYINLENTILQILYTVHDRRAIFYKYGKQKT